MTMESFLSKKLRQFSLLDLSLVKLVYFIFGLLVCSLYPDLSELNWWFYLVVAVIAALPLWVHMFSSSGSYIEKAKSYVKTNNPSNQMLLFLSVFFFAAMLAIIFPILASYPWWYYVVVIVILAIKPSTSNLFW